MRFLVSFFFIIGLISCDNNVIIKPKAELRLDYSKANYIDFKNDCEYNFQKNERAILVQKDNCGLNLHYPKMKATLYLTYKK